MYVKIIQSGNLIEKYIYEREPLEKRYRRVKKKRSNYKRLRTGLNSFVSRRRFLRLVQSNVGSQCPILLTLTMRQVVSVSVAYEKYSRFVQKVRKSFSQNIRIISVLEFQKRGAVHFHCLVWGLPFDPLSRGSSVVEERSGRIFAKLWGHGFVDAVWCDASPKVAGYMAKYMSKSSNDIRLSGQKAYTATRNCFRSVSFNSITTPVALDVFEEETGLSTDLPILEERKFDTLWMGRAIYQKYNLGNHE